MGESGGGGCGGGGMDFSSNDFSSSYSSGGSSGRSSGPSKPMTPEEQKGMLCMMGSVGFVVLIIYVLWPLAKQACGDGGDCNDVTRLGNVLCVDIMSTNASKGGQSQPWVSTNRRTGRGYTCQQYLIQKKCNLCKEKGPDWKSDWGEFNDYATRMADGGGLGCRWEGEMGGLCLSTEPCSRSTAQSSCHVLLTTHLPKI